MTLKNNFSNKFLFQLKKKKNILFFFSIIITCFIFFTLLQPTNALPNSQDETDVLTNIGNLEININDNDLIHEISLGEITTRSLTVENTGDTPVFVRAMIFPTLETNSSIVTSITNDDIIHDLNTNHWKDGRDGYYYYIKNLEPGKTTPEIFSKFSIPNTKQNGKLSFNIKVEATTTSQNEYRLAFWGSKNPPDILTLKNIDSLLDLQKD